MGVERLRGILDAVRSTGEREHRGDHRGGGARAADRRPVEYRGTLQATAQGNVGHLVIYGDSGVGIGVGCDIAHRPVAFATPPAAQSPTSLCQGWAVKFRLQPPPDPIHAASSPHTSSPWPSFRRVPPTAITCGEDAG